MAARLLDSSPLPYYNRNCLYNQTIRLCEITMSVLKRSPIPKHHQLAEFLRRTIRAGNLKPGDQVPTEEKLCARHGVSRGTVRQALDTLAQEGLLSREPGRGTFVRSDGAQFPHFTLANFVEDMRRQGFEPLTRVLRCRIIPAPLEVQKRLRLRPRTPVFHIERLRLANDRPVLFETRYLAERLCPELIKHNLEKESIHDLLTRRYNVPMTRAIHTIEVRLLSHPEAKLLEVSPGTPAFFVDRLTYTIGDRPAVWYQALYRGDEYHFRAEVDLSAGI